MIRPRLVILDLDGTLVDSFADIRHGIAEALAVLGVAPTDELMDMCRLGVGLELFYQRALDRDPYLPAERARLDAFVDAYRAAYAASPHRARPYDGVADTLAALRERDPDVRLAVATAKRTDMAEAVVADCGLAPYLDAVAGCDDLPHKPDPAVLRRAADRAGRPLDGAVMVGDTDRDVGAATRCGLRGDLRRLDPRRAGRDRSGSPAGPLLRLARAAIPVIVPPWGDAAVSPWWSSRRS